MRALRALLNDEIHRDACAVYTADVLGAIAGAFFRMNGANEFELPLFSDLAKPKEPEKTAAQIEAEVMEKLDKMSKGR